MKIATIHNSYQQPGGEDIVVAEETGLLESRGHKVVAYRRSNRELEGMSTPKLLLKAKDVVNSDRSKREIQQFLRNEAPDLVHIHNTFLMISPSAYAACKEEGVPVVQTLHNFRLLCPGAALSRNGTVCEECIDGSLWNGIRHGCYRNSRGMTAAVALMLKFHQMRGTWDSSVDSYVALTQFARGKFVEGGLPACLLHVKPNFIGTDPGEKTKATRSALFVGRLAPEKGAALLLSAWEKLRDPMTLTIIGDGPEKELLERQIAERHLKGVIVQPWVPREQVLCAMKDAAFLIVPSTCYEGFPMTIVEAFACGTPVVCSRLGAMQEIVSDGSTGLHFTPGDAADLAERIASLYSSPEQIREMGHAARTKYEELYTADKNYAALMRIYEETIATASRN